MDQTEQSRLTKLEIKVGKLETELPYITKAVDRIEDRLSKGQYLLIGMLVSFAVTLVVIFIRFFLSEIGGS